MKTDLTPRQRDYLKKIDRSAHSLLGIINDILDFSKIEAGKLTMERIGFDLEEVFDNLASMVGMRRSREGTGSVVPHRVRNAASTSSVTPCACSRSW